MKLLHMYKCDAVWLETPAIQPKYGYVYWHVMPMLEEHEEIEDVTKYQRVPIGTNPFK